MTANVSATVLSFVLVFTAIFLCPLTRPLLGFDMTETTDAVIIYLWLGATLCLLLALVEIPTLPEVVKQGTRYGIAVLLILSCVEALSAVVHRVLFGNWAHTVEKNHNRHLFEEHPQLIGQPKRNISYSKEGLTYTHNWLGFRGEQFPIEKQEGKKRWLPSVVPPPMV